jgi:hypothetical protein
MKIGEVWTALEGQGNISNDFNVLIPVNPVEAP